MNETSLLKLNSETLVNNDLHKKTKDFVFDVFEMFYGIADHKCRSVSKLTKVISKKLTSLIMQFGKKDGKVNLDDAKLLTERFMLNLPKVRELLDTDIDAIFNCDPACEDKEEIVAAYPGFFALFTYRIAHELYVLNIRVLPRIITEIAHSKTGIDINAGAKIGPYCAIDHGTGIVIGETTEIGSHVTIYQGVTLGALSTRGGQSLKGTKRHPTIKDYVTIYANATILGGETIIDSNLTIKANEFITKSVSKASKNDYCI